MGEISASSLEWVKSPEFESQKSFELQLKQKYGEKAAAQIFDDATDIFIQSGTGKVGGLSDIVARNKQQRVEARVKAVEKFEQKKKEEAQKKLEKAKKMQDGDLKSMDLKSMDTGDIGLRSLKSTSNRRATGPTIVNRRLLDRLNKMLTK